MGLKNAAIRPIRMFFTDKPAVTPSAMFKQIRLLFLIPLASVALAQSAPNTTLALIGYNALKTRAQPQGELGAQIAALDSAIRVASQRGQTAEVRRLIAKGTALLNSRAWADTNDYRQSLVLRAERVFVDPSLPYSLRLEQTFAPSIALAGNLSARATIRRAAAVATSANGPPAEGTRALGQFADVARDLRDSPLRLELDLSGTPDGDYMLEVDVADSARALGSARMRITVLANLGARLAALEAQAVTVTPDLRADIRYAADYVRKVDRAVIPIGGFDLSAELMSAEAIAASAKAGKHPFSGRTGGFERHYLLEAAGEVMPYRVFVPSTYDGKKAMPLIVALHGAGGTEDGFMDGYNRLLPQLAEQRGYLVATPLGFRVDGGYGSPILGGRSGANSEQDVMQVLARMRVDYKVDPSRIYLMGHSMGGIGTWHLGAKYPDLWAALGSFSGMGFPATVARMKAIPQFVVHGDADATVPVVRSREMVAEMKRLGVDLRYIEVAGGNHADVVVPNLAAMFEFFDAKRRPVP